MISAITRTKIDELLRNFSPVNSRLAEIGDDEWANDVFVFFLVFVLREYSSR